MSDMYYEGAMSAEEFAASLAAEQNAVGPCDCGEKTTEVSSCGCLSRSAAPVMHRGEEGCCCKQSFRAAFGLLCDEELASLLDFDLAAILTDHYSAGAAVTETVVETTPADNLVEPLAGSFRRLTPCSCDLVDISAPLYTPPATATGLTATQVNLCELTAVAIQLAAAEAEGDLTAEEVAARNFRRVRRILSRQLDPCTCREQEACCICDCDDCCCAAGLLASLAEGNLSRRVSLAVGPLLLSGVSLLGSVGNVLVLANDEALRIYFVCVNKVEFII